MGGSFKWPEVYEVLEYRNKVRQMVNDVIDNTPLQLPVTQDSPWVNYKLSNTCQDIQLVTHTGASRFTSSLILSLHTVVCFYGNGA